MGTIELTPGAFNVVPSRARATIDMRNPSDALLSQMEDELIAFYNKVAAEDGVQIEWERRIRTRAVDFDPAVQDVIEASARECGLDLRRMLSGAGHDAQEWAQVARAGMIFIPGEFDGVSHSPREHSTKAQCAAGANVLLRTLLTLSAKP
jgi:N-carbamoyl-L-amino-acid hydrolase